MDQDFDEMMRMRNEAKKRLEEQFKDVYQKIKDNKQHTINEGRKVNDSLKQFQDKFIELMNQLSTELTDQIKYETDYMESERVRGHDRMQYLEDLLSKEREDRIDSLESQLVPVRQNLRKIETDINQERSARVQKEREILENLQEESQKIENAINVEKEERQAKQAELYAKVAQEIDRENQWIDRFQRETMSEFNKDRTDIEKEMDNRFKHQDEIVRNIQHFISTFQKTLKAVGNKQ
eukprot:403348623